MSSTIERVGPLRALRIALGASVFSVLLLAVYAGGALAAEPASSWSVESVAPNYFATGSSSSYAVLASASISSGEVTISDELPAGLEVKAVSFYWSGAGFGFGLHDLNALAPICPASTGRRLTCHFTPSAVFGGLLGNQIEPGQTVRMVVRLTVPASAPQGAVTSEAVVEGGGLTSASTSWQGAVSSHPPLEIAKLTVQPTETTREESFGGPLGSEVYEFVNEPYKQPFTQAGGHPWALTTAFEFASEAKEANSTGEIALVPARDPKDIVADLPPGLLGDPQAVPRCPLTNIASVQQSGEEIKVCPADTQIGVWRVHFFTTKEELAPIVNVTPEAGQSAEFALEDATPGVVTPLLTAQLVRTSGGYGFDVTGNGVAAVGIRSVELTFWGVPADPSHDAMRGRFCGTTDELDPGTGSFEHLGCKTFGHEASNLTPVPFLTLPTGCSAGPESFTLRADSWQEPGGVGPNGQYTGYTEKTVPFPAVTGCNLLQFNAGTGVTVEPDTQTADEPVGLGVGLQIPLNNSPATNATPQLRDTVITLPEGMSISPGVVDGIRACEAFGPEGINITGPESEVPGLNGELRLAPGKCPDASIVGTAEAITPFLSVPVKGHVYLARPKCGGSGEPACTNQDALDGHLYQLYLELGGTGEFANTGIEFKVPLETEVNPATGQLTAVSRELVQAPYSEVKVHLNGGPRAPLDNPAVCGVATTNADFTPWSAPGTTPEGLAVPGTADGTSSSFFNVDLAGDGLATPCPGLPLSPGFSAGTVSPQAGAFSAFTLNLTRRDQEQYVKGVQVHTPPGLLGMLSSVPLCEEPLADSGHCPESSRIGSTRVASGAGSHPFEISGNVYLTKGYGGAPFGLSIVTDAVAGPFNLGLVVVRARIAVNPVDSSLTITTDETGPHAIPQILFGVPLRLKQITVNIDRPNFMFNPTDCGAQQITAAISGSGQAVAHVASPFAAAGCKSLEFKPHFAVSTSAHTSKANGASLDARVTYPAFKAGSESNIAYVKVELPKQLPSRLTTLQQACTAAQFEANPAGCPAASIVGIARASTPLLPVGLEGPVYFVSHGGEAFPSLIVVLQGDGVRVNLTGSTFISKSGITSSTFKTVPDVPVSSFELYLPEGKFSALAANGNLCTEQSKLAMPTEFVAQNGAVMKQNTKIAVSGCNPAITVVGHKVKGNTATLTVSVPSAGKLTATGTDLSNATGTTSKPGNVTVRLTLTKAGSALLEKHKGRKLQAKVKLTFTPKQGAKLKTTVTVLVGGKS